MQRITVNIFVTPVLLSKIPLGIEVIIGLDAPKRVLLNHLATTATHAAFILTSQKWQMCHSVGLVT